LNCSPNEPSTLCLSNVHVLFTHPHVIFSESANRPRHRKTNALLAKRSSHADFPFPPEGQKGSWSKITTSPVTGER
jgi:hypothetical protein